MVYIILLLLDPHLLFSWKLGMFFNNRHRLFHHIGFLAKRSHHIDFSTVQFLDGNKPTVCFFSDFCHWIERDPHARLRNSVCWIFTSLLSVMRGVLLLLLLLLLLTGIVQSIIFFSTLP